MRQRLRQLVQGLFRESNARSQRENESPENGALSAAPIALSENELHFSQLAEAVHDFVWLVAPGWTEIYYMSPAFEELFGRSREDAYVRPQEWLDAVEPEDREKIQALVNARVSRSGGGPVAVEFSVRRPDGSVRRLEARAFPICDEQRNILRIAGITQDITERTKAAIAQRESEAQLRTLIASLPGAVYRCDAQHPWVATQLSDGILNICGRSAADFREQGGFSFAEIVHPEDLAEVSDIAQNAVRTRQPFRIVYRISHADGSTRWVYDAGMAHYDEHGQALWIDGVLLDVTDQKLAEESIHGSRQRLALIFEQTQVGVIEWDADFRVTLWNPAAEAVFGYTREEAIGRFGPSLLVPDEARVQLNAVWNRLMERAGGVQSVNSNRTKDGRIIMCEWFNTPLVDARGRTTGVASVVRDITERIRAERERERLVAELEAANKELESLLYAASHDLRAPVINVQGFSHELRTAAEELQALIPPEALPEAARAKVAAILTQRIPTAVHHITAGGRRMDLLIDGLLRTCRIGREAVRLETVDMNRVVEAVLASMAFQIRERGVSVSVEPLPPCRGDAGQLHRVVANLLDNAVKYRDPSRPPTIRVCGKTEGETAVYCVEDNGIGIASAHQAKVWELFHRLDPRGSVAGEGLGLTIVRRIIERQHGQVRVESEPGRGSRFFISLPQPGNTPDLPPPPVLP